MALYKKVIQIIKRREPIEVKEAIIRIMEKTHPLRKGSKIPIEEAYGYVLSEPLIAEHDVPWFNRSPFDGYAIRSYDTMNASGKNRISFLIVDEIAAGDVPSTSLGHREASRIMTGAQLPKNADAIVRFEQTILNDNTFTIRRPFDEYENVSLIGEDIKKGEELISSGETIHPGVVALLATFGYSTVPVTRKPTVGIVSVGTKLLNVGDDLVPGRIRNSNEPMLIAQLARMGITSRSYSPKVSNYEGYKDVIIQALSETDCLITTGGVSVGDFDYMPRIYKSLGAELLFNKVSMRPGSVTSASIINNKILFGLSGNPSACFTGFELFVRPSLLKMMRANKPFLPSTKAILAEDHLKVNPTMRFVRAFYEITPSKAVVKPVGFNKSNSVSSIAQGNALIVFQRGTRGHKAGTEVDVLLLGVEEGVKEWTL